MVQKDYDVQSWWQEVREKGNGDKKHEPWWPKMIIRNELLESCTTIICIASALHAALNFGQYPYGGYPPNRATMSRCLLPEPDTTDYDELESNPECIHLNKVFLEHRDTAKWTTDMEAIKAFGRFGKKLEEIEKRIDEMNCDKKIWRNRVRPVDMPCTLLYLSSEVGLTGKGIPNSLQTLMVDIWRD
ncbi:hypothetical protein LguiB_021048 [Lonicera macranthoides]